MSIENKICPMGSGDVDISDADGLLSCSGPDGKGCPHSLEPINTPEGLACVDEATASGYRQATSQIEVTRHQGSAIGAGPGRIPLDMRE